MDAFGGPKGNIGVVLRAAVGVMWCLPPVVAVAQTVKTAADLGFEHLPPGTEILVIENDPALEPAHSFDNVAPVRLPNRFKLGLDGSENIEQALGLRGSGLRVGCADEGFSTLAYARDTGGDWAWLPANTIIADDLTLAPGSWTIGCYDVLIYADNSPTFGCNANRMVTLTAYDACTGSPIPDSTASYTVPPRGGPVLLTAVTDINFLASGTIWLALTTTINGRGKGGKGVRLLLFELPGRPFANEKVA